MDNGELLIKVATWDHPEQLPVLVGVLPSIFIKYGDKMKKLMLDYPDFFGESWQNYNPYENMPKSYHKGKFTDPWGCVWSNEEDGMESIVTEHPVPEREMIHTMKLPDGDFGLPHGFMYLRLLDLRGFEEGMMDFAEEPEELQILIDKVLGYNMRQMELLLKNHKAKMIFFGDDLGMQKGLAMGPVKWRKYMKPCYAKLYKLCKDDGRLIYMHTDGCIWEIMPDLVDAGVDIINPQYRANGLDNLVRVCKGKIPICLDLDRQLFPFGTPADMVNHVKECITSLYLPEGGLAINCELGHDVSLDNMKALLDTLYEYRFYKG